MLNKNQKNNKPKKSILLVDDDKRMLALLETALSKAGYSISTAASITQAEAALQAGGTLPDLAIIDVHLEDQNGFVLAQHLHLAQQQVPVIFLSGDTLQETIQQASALGAVSYLVKPISVAQLISTAEIALAVAQQMRDLHNNRDQLEAALNADRDISVCIGIIMMHYRVDKSQAFEIMRKLARKQRRKLADIAPEIIQASATLNLSTLD